MTGAPLDITQVDPHDDETLTAWWEVYAASTRQEVGAHATYWAFPELAAGLRTPVKHRQNLLYVGSLDGRVVAAGMLTLPQLDNLDSADVQVAVHPEVRRRRIGTALLTHLEAVAAEHGRTRLDAMAEWLHDGPADGSGVPGVEFGRVHGYRFGLGEVQRELTLPVDAALLEASAREVAPHHEGYEIRSWRGPVPENFVVSWLELASTLMTEAPTGETVREDEAVDVEAFRMGEALNVAQRRTRWHTVALDETGTVVAYTDLVVPALDPGWVFQWGTLVHRDHRGHRLGTAVKVANLQALQAGDPGVAGRRLVTWNAEVNSHMIGINERLGFAPTARSGNLQKQC